MITPPPTWQRALGQQALLLTPPWRGGRVRYHERLAARPFEALVDALLRGEGFRATLKSPVSRFLTEEGELGAWCGLAGEDEDGPARRWIGAVLCDEFVAAIDAVSHDPVHDDVLMRTARWLIERASFGLGVRRRRFLYERPPGWQGIASGLVATYFPPDYPRHDAFLEVHPAEPSTLTADEALAAIRADELRRGLVRRGAEQVTALATPAGLGGRQLGYAGTWPVPEGPRAHELALLTDGRYRYVARLESAGDAPLEADREVLRALVASIEALPLPGGRDPGAASSAELTSPWLE